MKYDHSSSAKMIFLIMGLNSRKIHIIISTLRLFVNFSNIILFHQSAIIKSVCQIYVDIGVNMFAATNEVQTIRKLGMQTTFIRRTPSKLPIDVVKMILI